MSSSKQAVPGAAEGARRATGEAPGTGRHGKGRWSAKRKMGVVLELLRGDDLETFSRKYGRARVLAVWGQPRSTFYARQQRARQSVAPQRRGPKTKYTDANLLEKIRTILAASPFHGEGHRKIWARLRVQDVRTSKPRVLRLMRSSLDLI